jgi:hypothetical protein
VGVTHLVTRGWSWIVIQRWVTSKIEKRKANNSISFPMSEYIKKVSSKHFLKSLKKQISLAIDLNSQAYLCRLPLVIIRNSRKERRDPAKKEEKAPSQLGKHFPQQLQSLFYTHTKKRVWEKVGERWRWSILGQLWLWLGTDSNRLEPPLPLQPFPSLSTFV